MTKHGKNRTTPVRSVDFAPPPGWSSAIEITDLARVRRRGGPGEFRGPQRPGFELIVHIVAGVTVHEVDFRRYTLEPGDVLWVHAGQVQRWGDIAAIEGEVFLVPPAALDATTSALLAGLGAGERNHWAGIAPAGSGLAAAFAGTREAATRLQGAPLLPQAREATIGHLVASVLVQVAGDSSIGSPAPQAQDQLFQWFRDDLERRFTSDRTVASYAARLGYSARTLNRSALAHAGVSAKALIDRRVVLEAKRRLAHEGVPVAEIAAALGFDDASNFSKFFTARVGLTPLAFRDEARAGGD